MKYKLIIKGAEYAVRPIRPRKEYFVVQQGAELGYTVELPSRCSCPYPKYCKHLEAITTMVAEEIHAETVAVAAETVAIAEGKAMQALDAALRKPSPQAEAMAREAMRTLEIAEQFK